MSEMELIEKILRIPELRVFGVEIRKDSVQVRAEVVFERGMCPDCGQVSGKTHQTPVRTVRHLACCGVPCYITFYERQMECTKCERTFIAPMDFLLRPQGQYTRAYGEYLFERVRGSSIKVVAEQEGIPERTLQEIYYQVAHEREKAAKPEPT